MKQSKSSPLMVLVRLVLPSTIVISGIILAAITQSEAGYEAGALLVSAGMAVFLLNLLFRLGVHGDRDRKKEEEARRYYDRHGRWPN